MGVELFYFLLKSILLYTSQNSMGVKSNIDNPVIFLHLSSKPLQSSFDLYPVIPVRYTDTLYCFLILLHI